MCWDQFPAFEQRANRLVVSTEQQNTILKLAPHCPRLRYIRIGSMAWRIHRILKDAAGLDCVLEELDEWEDQVEGPAEFHAPMPLPWSHLVEHAEW